MNINITTIYKRNKIWNCTKMFDTRFLNEDFNNNNKNKALQEIKYGEHKLNLKSTSVCKNLSVSNS